MKKLIKIIQTYRDRKFKARLERVLNNNIIEANLAIDGWIINTSTLHIRKDKVELSKIVLGKHPLLKEPASHLESHLKQDD